MRVNAHTVFQHNSRSGLYTIKDNKLALNDTFFGFIHPLSISSVVLYANNAFLSRVEPGGITFPASQNLEYEIEYLSSICRRPHPFQYPNPRCPPLDASYLGRFDHDGIWHRHHKDKSTLLEHPSAGKIELKVRPHQCVDVHVRNEDLLS